MVTTMKNKKNRYYREENLFFRVSASHYYIVNFSTTNVKSCKRTQNYAINLKDISVNGNHLNQGPDIRVMLL